METTDRSQPSDVSRQRTRAAEALAALPGSDDDGAGPPSAPPPSGRRGYGGPDSDDPAPIPARVLVVDDDPGARDHLVRRLRRRGLDVTAVAHGREALDHVAEHGLSIDLVLLDIMMPDMDGMQVLRSLRERHGPIDLPVIMVTAKSDNRDVIDALNAGANDYVTKPIEMSAAFARLRTQLNLKRTHAALRASEERYVLAARSVSDGLWDWDLERDRIHFSERWKATLGLDKDAMGDDPEEWFERVHPDERAELTQAIRRHLDGETDSLQAEYRIRHEDGSYRRMVCTGLAARGDAGQAVRLVGSQTDVTRIRTRDGMTGLPNRLMLSERIDQLIGRARRTPGTNFAVLFFDLDGFKEVNDTFGHAAGDLLLQAVAERLAAAVRDQDMIARVGGDEFVVLAEDIDDTGQPGKVAQRLLAVFDTPIPFGSKEVMIGASVGISLHPDDGTSASELLSHADTAMYRAKKKGTGGYEFYTEEMTRSDAERIAMETALHRALERDELALWYFPFVTLATGRTAGGWADPVWFHPRSGRLVGEAFMPLAGTGPLAAALGWRLVQLACHDIRAAEDAGRPLGRVVVPVPDHWLRRGDLAPHLSDLIAAAGVDPGRLILLLPGNTVARSRQRFDAAEVTHGLREIGVGLAIDEFGSSAVSLADVRALALDLVKLPVGFVRALDDDPTAASLVDALVAAADACGLETYASNVDTPGQRDRLLRAGCTYASGSLFGAHCSAAELSGD